jgi:hypothetical protein
LKDFIREWEGIKYKIYTACPSCKVHRPKERPQFWELDVDRLYDDIDSMSCRLESEMVDKWLVFPPPC